MKKRSVENKRHNELLKRDIHENNKAYLEKVYKNAKFVSEKYGWINIDCSENDGLKSIENIHSMIIEQIQ